MSQLTLLFQNLQREDNNLNLQEFLFRSDKDARGCYRHINDFLRSFPGLRLSSLLFNYTDLHVFELDEEVLQRHGERLEVLVLESRHDHRRSSGFHYSHANFHEGSTADGRRAGSLSKIIRNCPGLTELSLCFHLDSRSDGYGRFLQGPVASLTLNMHT